MRQGSHLKERQSVLPTQLVWLGVQKIWSASKAVGQSQLTRGHSRDPDRTVIFLGDFIDRGPKIREVLEIVRPMIEEGTAKGDRSGTQARLGLDLVESGGLPEKTQETGAD